MEIADSETTINSRKTLKICVCGYFFLIMFQCFAKGGLQRKTNLKERGFKAVTSKIEQKIILKTLVTI